MQISRGDFVHIFGNSFAVSRSNSFGGSKGQHLSGIHHTGHNHALVHHRFRQLRIAFPHKNRIARFYYRVTMMAFGSCTNHRPHIRLIFVGSSGPIHRNYRSSTNRAASAHINTVARNRYQCSGRCGIIIDEGNHRKRKIENCGTHRIGLLYASSVRIDVQ
ncbi:MAG: hypothetical protein BWZ06_01904 [Bacteroidetes bacterium ADurb.BinA261]|nr:MAG: hypothetical protein BWZ06_01904 [Bacteroidetes bacterium ADurb.BinA261]